MAATEGTELTSMQKVEMTVIVCFLNPIPATSEKQVCQAVEVLLTPLEPKVEEVEAALYGSRLHMI